MYLIKSMFVLSVLSGLLSVSCRFTQGNDETNQLDSKVEFKEIQAKVAPCKYLYVYQEGCPKSSKRRLYAASSTVETPLGSQKALRESWWGQEGGFDIVPIQVSSIGTPNQFYWTAKKKRFYLYWQDPENYGIDSTPKTAKAAWFHVSPGKTLQASVMYKGSRRFTDFVAYDSDYESVPVCEEFIASFDYPDGFSHNNEYASKRKLIVESCVN